MAIEDFGDLGTEFIAGNITADELITTLRTYENKELAHALLFLATSIDRVPHLALSDSWRAIFSATAVAISDALVPEEKAETDRLIDEVKKITNWEKN